MGVNEPTEQMGRIVGDDESGFPDDKKVWRYMAFSRFVWMLARKRLWLSRIDLLGDSWELTLAGDPLTDVVSNPIYAAVLGPDPWARARELVKGWRSRTFVNCWSASDYESNALWQIYCPDREGVVIQTTLGRLRESVAPLQVLPVRYCESSVVRTADVSLTNLATAKRPVFAYEHEVRVVQKGSPLEGDVVGHGLEWSAEAVVESVRVHPRADFSFIEAVNAVMKTYMPSHRGGAEWSVIAASPPL